MINKAIAQLFPGKTMTGTEVNGLSTGTVPQNCTILQSGKQETYNHGRREFYLVKTEEVLVYLRVCTAWIGSGYDEFAVVCSWEPVDSNDAAEMEHWARESMDILCK
jgi:hypothetical protein